MQKYLWGGAALIVASAATCYVGVDYASRHPESYLGRLGVAVGAMSARCNPVGTAGTAVTGIANGAPAAENIVAENTTPDLGVPVGASIQETIEPIQVEPLPQGEQPVGWHRIETTEDSEPIIDFSGITVATEEPTVPMPYAEENGFEDLVTQADFVEDNTATGRHYANGKYVLCNGKKVWLAFTVKKVLGSAAVEQDVDVEECEDASSYCTFEQVLGMLRGELIWDGCRTSELISEMPVEDEDAGETQEDMPPMTEEIHGSYHHHSCPYMGGCPYYGSVRQSQSPVRIPDDGVVETTEERTEVEYDTPSLRRLRSFVKVQKVSVWDSFLRQFVGQRCNPFVDTMEFRPSDAGSSGIEKVGGFLFRY
jgi:hypothetical protein